MFLVHDVHKHCNGLFLPYTVIPCKKRSSYNVWETKGPSFPSRHGTGWNGFKRKDILGSDILVDEPAAMDIKDGGSD